MTAKPNIALLPAGLHDVLPPLADHEARLVADLLAAFAAHGYERVDPPLVEFEDSLLAGSGAATAAQTFRLMDPVSQRMMGVRSDMTVQVARIATSRLRDAARPLRLSYAGDVLMVRGSQLRPERQFRQVGAELIGSDEPTADAEAVLLAVEALAAIGIENLSVDLNSPTLVGALADGFDLDEAARRRLREALDRKDAAAVAAIGGPAAGVAEALLATVGSADSALASLAAIDLPEAARADADRLVEVAELIRGASLDFTLTLDPVEYRGFEYQTGVSFTLFARGVRGELGRGGRYLAGNGALGGGEPATGFSLYMDTVLRAAPGPTPVRRVYLPFGVAEEEARRLRAEGWATVAALAEEAEPEAAARRLGCDHIYWSGAIVAVEP